MFAGRLDGERLPEADLVIADLLIECIGYESFQRAIRCAKPEYVSRVFQINEKNAWVSDSPYLHVFDRLEGVHRPVDQAVPETGYRAGRRLERGFPNGKKLMRIDFERGEAL